MSVVSEIETTFSSLGNFYSLQRSSILSGSGNPNPATLLTQLENKEVLTYVLSQVDFGSGFEIGAAQDALATGAAISREHSSAVKKKADLYDDHFSDSGAESIFYKQSGVYFAGVVKGNPTSGSQC